MAFKGDFRKLGDVIERMAKVARGDFVKASAQHLGEIAHRLARESAAAGVSPAGRPWKPKKDGGRALAGAGSQLRRGQSDTSVVISATKPWLFFHQVGAKRVARPGGFRRATVKGRFVIRRVQPKVGWRLPKRAILPTRSLPKRWSEPMMRRLVAEWAKQWR